MNKLFPEGLRERINGFIRIEGQTEAGPIVRVIIGSNTFKLKREDALILKRKLHMNFYGFCAREQAIMSDARSDEKSQQLFLEFSPEKKLTKEKLQLWAGPQIRGSATNCPADCELREHQRIRDLRKKRRRDRLREEQHQRIRDVREKRRNALQKRPQVGARKVDSFD